MERNNPHLQVFISFRGKDVRGNILSSLKEKLKDEGVNVKTDEEMPRGRKIDENLLKLIRDSKVAVVIFSENYPESTWCLDELVEIKKQMELKKLAPLPIFFDVKASHVALKEHNPFKDILLRLEDDERENARNGSRVGSGRMHCWSCFLSRRLLKDADKRFVRWREALKSITGYSGLKYIKDRCCLLVKSTFLHLLDAFGYNAPFGAPWKRTYMDLGKLYNDDSFVIGSNQALFVNQIVETVKEMLDKVQSSDEVHGRIRGQHIVPQQKVFISFGGHGDDTRLGFISHFQAGLKRSGINFYINIENMTKGYDPEELIMNVRESRIALVIFTESYLSSAWCLEELVEINKYTMSLVVIPIFYKVEPKYVRDGRLVEINNQLVLNWGATDVRINRWKQALNSVGERLGFVYANPSSEAEFVEYIICETKRTLANTSSS